MSNSIFISTGSATVTNLSGSITLYDYSPHWWEVNKYKKLRKTKLFKLVTHGNI